MKIIVSSVFSRTQYREFVGNRDAQIAFAEGFRKLGHEVFVFEEVAEDHCLDANHQMVPFNRWEGRTDFLDAMIPYGFENACGLILEGGRGTFGLDWDACRAVARGADLLLVVGGRFRTPELLDSVRHKAYLDINPGKTQAYAFDYDVDYGLDAFDSHFSVGLAVGTPACPIPTGGLSWKPLTWPVVMERWEGNGSGEDRFTTLSSWGRKSQFVFRGVKSGDKVEQWLNVLDLPLRTDQSMEIGLPVDSVSRKDLDLLGTHGWQVMDARRLQTLDDYVQYITGSRAEFSVANGRYVKFTTGWFSDRSARYLAAGRPILVQSTGIETHLPVGEGILTFRTLDEALGGIDRINCDYARHSRAAREIARQHFDSDRVLGGLLCEVGLA